LGRKDRAQPRSKNCDVEESLKRKKQKGTRETIHHNDTESSPLGIKDITRGKSGHRTRGSSLQEEIMNRSQKICFENEADEGGTTLIRTWKKKGGRWGPEVEGFWKRGGTPYFEVIANHTGDIFEMRIGPGN